MKRLQTSPPIRPCLRARVFTHPPPADLLARPGGFDEDIRKDGARRPLIWNDDPPVTDAGQP